jgi:hypothetical protein
MTWRGFRFPHAALLFAALTVAMTWPQAIHLGTHVGDADDPLLSIWRLSWIAHALTTSPSQLLNGNIFHPELRTLAYTDAVPLQGTLATPFILTGNSPVVVYNLLLLGSIALSGAAMWLLARRFTDNPYAAVLAGIVFAFVPFRFDHYMHLELHATVFVPLALWWLDRAIESGSWRDVAGFAGALVLQTFCGVYYTVFLLSALAVALPLRLPDVPVGRRRPLLVRLAAAAVVSAVLVAPYLSIYMRNRDVVGERSLREVLLYSATWTNYLAAPQDNVVHGWWSHALGAPERRLLPGFVALALAAVGVIGGLRRKTMVGIVGLVLSMGLNTPVYAALREVVFTYRGLRAPARAAMLVFLALALLAAWGWARVLPRIRGSPALATAVVAVLMLGEYATANRRWLVLPDRPAGASTWLARQAPSVVVEFPLPRPDRLDSIQDGLYMYESIFHWQPMLNGYSGFYPRSYLELLEKQLTFPDDASVDYLKQRGVDLIVLHGRYMAPDQFGKMAAALSARQDVSVVAEFPEQGGADLVFRLNRGGRDTLNHGSAGR